MRIISVRDNENNRWKRDVKKNEKKQQTKTEKKKGDRTYSEKWELNDFVVHLS